jgi:hypothetical protein
MASKNRLEKLEKVVKPEAEDITIRISNDKNLTDEDWQRMIEAGQVIRIQVKENDSKNAY